MKSQRWLLSPAERDNPHTVLDRRHDGVAWTDGNAVRVLVHGATYFSALCEQVRALRAGDLLLFTDWRGDPDERLDGAGSEVVEVLCDAARRGVMVKGLVWRSHLDRFQFSEQENRHLGEQLEAAGAECLRDMRVRPGGSHHQKLVVLRHADRPEDDVAFVGGIDLCHSRRDDSRHNGDPQRQPMAAVYGSRPPWHDVQLEIRGPAVGDLEASFRERWDDPAALTRNPVDRLIDAFRGEDEQADPMPAQTPDPPVTGSQTVQVLRTYPWRIAGYPFAPRGERSIARAYRKVASLAHSLIYLEDQYFWSTAVVEVFARALADSPTLRFIAVVPRYPDQDGRFSLPPNLVGRQDALAELSAAGGERVAVYSPENHAGVPVYVHAKVVVVDDVWASVGSDNINRRSWTHDSELSCAVLDAELDGRAPQAVDRFGDGARRFARDLRLELAREHLDRPPGDDDDLVDPVSAFEQFALSARRLQDWYDGGCAGTRPPGRLRPYPFKPLRPRTMAWARPVYRTLYDPDGRPFRLRRRNAY